LEQQGPVPVHGTQAQDAGGGLFTAADDLFGLLDPLFVQQRHQVGPIIDYYLGLAVQGQV